MPDRPDNADFTPPPERASTDPAVVRSALVDQLDCYRRLLKLAEEQSAHVFAGDSDRLLAVLNRREALTAEAAELEGSLSAVKSNWPKSAAAWSEEDREAVAALFAEIKAVLAELTRRDDQDAAALRAQLAMTAGELRRVQTDDRLVRRINQRYAAAAYASPAKKIDISR